MDKQSPSVATVARIINKHDRCPHCGQPMTTECAAALAIRSPQCGQ